MPVCNRIEATIVDLIPDGGPQGSLFPAIVEEEWRRDVLETVAPMVTCPAIVMNGLSAKPLCGFKERLSPTR